MEYGTSFNGEWLADIGSLRRAASELDEEGIDFVSYGGHVLTSPLGRYERPPSTYAVPFRDFFVLFSNLAATTTRLRFRSGILILPMFQTVLVAKQAADLSLVSDGRFELGVGISWNEPEYTAMGQDLTTRGRRLEEQLVVLRQLWTEEFVTYHGQFHDIDDLGIGQLPTKAIPIWIGCGEGATSLARGAARRRMDADWSTKQGDDRRRTGRGDWRGPIRSDWCHRSCCRSTGRPWVGARRRSCTRCHRGQRDLDLAPFRKRRRLRHRRGDCDS